MKTSWMSWVSERDSGIYNAMNKGAALARGDYICFLTVMTIFCRMGFNEAVALLARQRPEILSCRSEVVSEAGQSLDLLRLSVWRLFFFNTVPHLATFVRLDLQRSTGSGSSLKSPLTMTCFSASFLVATVSVHRELITATHYRGGFSGNVPLTTIECRQIRRENLGGILYAFTRALEGGNGVLNAIVRRVRRATGKLS
jgi:hypothetical protein